MNLAKRTSDDRDDLDQLSPEQYRCIEALLTEPTIAKAAQAVGVTERTVYRWLKEPAFARVHRQAMREGFRHAMSLTRRYSPVAVQTLLKIMADPAAPWTAKVQACSVILKFSRESLELDELSERLEQLEQVVDIQNGPRPGPGMSGSSWHAEVRGGDGGSGGCERRSERADEVQDDGGAQ